MSDIEVLAQLDAELAWEVVRADAKYVVLNACRAAALATDGVVLSKIGGGQWGLAQWPGSAVITEALCAQISGAILGPADERVSNFVNTVRRQLR